MPCEDHKMFFFLPHLYPHSHFLFLCLLIFERERERERKNMSGGGAEREGETEDLKWALWAGSSEPDVGLQLMRS